MFLASDGVCDEVEWPVIRYTPANHSGLLPDRSVEAFRLACDLARQNQSDLVVLHAKPKTKAQPLPTKDQVTDEQLAEATLQSMETELGPKFLP